MQGQKNPVTRWLGGVLIVVGALVVNTFLAPAAFATFPGADGEIAFQWTTPDPTDLTGLTYLFTIDGTQLTAVNGTVYDTAPKYSPDGSRVAFIENGPSGSTVQIMYANGTNRQTILTQASAGLPNPATFLSVAWLSDGLHLVASVETPGPYNLGGIFEFAADGSGFTQVFANMAPDQQTVFELDGSPADNSIAFRCRFRYGPGGSGFLRDDYCLLDPNGGLAELPVEPPVTLVLDIDTLSPPHFTPDGTSLIFAMHYADPLSVQYSCTDPYYPASKESGTTSWVHGEIFQMNLDGTGFTQLTTSQPVTYSATTPNGQFICGVTAALAFDDALMSPDSLTVVGHGLQMYPSSAEKSGFWSLNPASSSPPSLIASERLNGTSPARPDWQAFPNAFAVIMQDGHGNPLNGLNVQLFQSDGKTPAGGTPVNTTGGQYVFPQSIAAGTYQLQATLTDNCQPAGCIPWFDIFYAPGPAAPVQATFTINFDPNEGPITVNFSDMNSSLLSSNIGMNPSDLDNLDAMADIYFRVRQFTDWVKAHLTSTPIPTVHYYTFATVDPILSEPMPPKRAQYDIGKNAIVMGTIKSAYKNRDGTIEPGFPSDSPENGEWHEFTHHLWFSLVNPNSCGAQDESHGGYNNPDTCDSFYEGFAEFLPTLAAQDIMPTTSADYAHMGNLDADIEAWQYTPNASFDSDEDLAVASLLWDLVKPNTNIQRASCFARNGSVVLCQYSDLVSMSLGQLWTQLTTPIALVSTPGAPVVITLGNPVTVADLHASFGLQTPVVDLDGDGVPDVSTLDEVFLMHGFFPIDQHSSPSGYDIPWFDVGYAQRAGMYPFDADVGMTSHHLYTPEGTLDGQLIPRFDYPFNPNATVGVTVIDTNGEPVQGASIHMVFHYPDGQVDTEDVSLGASTVQLPLLLPPYFNYALPAGAALPACNPATDFYADVTLSAQASGQSSAQTVVLDNCTYLNAVAATQAPPALTYSFTVPATGPTMYTLTLTTAGTGSGSTSGAGTYTAGQSVSVAATPSPGSAFSGWSGPNGTECATGAVVMSANKSCTATFTAMVTVPNVVGDTQAAATSAITGAGMTVGTISSANSSTVPSGSVISQSPSAGTNVSAGSAVNITVSTGPASVMVPNVVGNSQAVATSTISGASFSIGIVTQQSNMIVRPGVVISQSPAAGSSAAAGSAVNLIVSSGSTCADLALVKAAFGSRVGQTTYNPVADVNKDGVVNILDLSTVARALPAGTTCN